MHYLVIEWKQSADRRTDGRTERRTYAGWFVVLGALRQCFSQYRAVLQRKGERIEIDSREIYH